ncbi:hypothetical protein BOQ64_01040 [Chryseobacterium sp. CH25]|nr:hypothetical protein BOQ64_01040 [Chryseobacterium sp. CH25]RXM65782.1 hypothetical protein BOQ60_08470 [Chryseobacterium sp. CH1]
MDLKVPIYSIPTSGGKNIDVFVSYDSSGFLPHKKSDFAGMGWSMLAGGRITRTLNRIPDEYQGNPTWMGSSPFDSGVDFHGFLTGVRLNAYSNAQVYDLNSGAGGITGLDWRLGTVENGYEGEPDIFNFNAMGLSGKFVIGNDGNVLVESEDPNIKVDLSGMVSYGGKEFCKPPNQTIVVTDGQGNKYYFGGDFSKYEISYSLPQPGMSKNNWFKGFPYISSFSLSKVEFTNGQTVTFGYVQDTLNSTFCSLATSSSNVMANSKLMNFEGYYQDGARIDDWQNCPGGWVGCGSAISSTSNLSENFVLTKRSLLESITYGTHQIKINYKDVGYPIKHYEGSSSALLFNEYVIDNIQLLDNNHLIQNNVFTYEDLGGTNRRPFLKNITNPVSNKVYGFEYYNTDNLPRYVTKGIDHWGYWNGNDNNQNLAPYDTYNAITGDYTLNNTFRDPNVQKYNVGLLSKIIYPTKGYSVFEYEAPYYGQRVERTSASAFLPILMNNGGAIGGARIKKQYDYSENGGIINNKEYRYTNTLNGTTSSGILMNWPRYIYYIEFNTPTSYQKLMIRSSSNVQQNSLDSYNIGYQKVYEIDAGKGITEYDFTSYVDYPDIMTPDAGNLREYNNMGSPSPLNLYKNFKNLYGIDRTILRGKLKTKTIYSEGSTNPLNKTEFTYNDNIDYNPNNTKDNNNYVSFNHLSGAWVQGYKKYMNSSSIKKKTVTDFFNNAPIKTTTEYLYDNNIHLNLTKEKTEYSSGDIYETKYQYTNDILHGSPNHPASMVPPYAFLVNFFSKDLLGIPLVVSNYKNNKFLNRTQTLYEFTQNNDIYNITRPRKKLYYTEEKNVISQPMITLPDTNYGSVEVSYDQYDDKGNILQYTTKDGVSTVIIWGYNKTQPIAKIENAKLENIGQSLIDSIVNASNTDALLTPNADETTFLSALNTFRNSLATYQVSTYTYDPLIGVRSITPPSGIRESYLYDSANRLEKVVDANGNILKEMKYNYKN